MDGFGIVRQSMMAVNGHKKDSVIEVGLKKAIAFCQELHLQSLVID